LVSIFLAGATWVSTFLAGASTFLTGASTFLAGASTFLTGASTFLAGAIGVAFIDAVAILA